MYYTQYGTITTVQSLRSKTRGECRFVGFVFDTQEKRGGGEMRCESDVNKMSRYKQSSYGHNAMLGFGRE